MRFQRDPIEIIDQPDQQSAGAIGPHFIPPVTSKSFILSAPASSPSCMQTPVGRTGTGCVWGELEMTKTIGLALAALLASSIAAGAQQLPALSGLWDCVVNGYHANIQVRMQLAPNGSLMAQGWLQYNQTSSQGNFQGTGNYGVVPPEAGAPDWRYGFRIVRQNGPMVTLYAGPTNNPNWLYNVYQNPQTGAQSKTSCNRIG